MKKNCIVLFALLLILSFYPKNSIAGVFDLSAGGSYTNTAYSSDSYKKTWSWYTALSYYFTEFTALEFAYARDTEKTKIENFQNTTTKDQAVSMNWIQSILGRSAPIQPFVKAGAGQLYRKVEGSFADGSSPPRRVQAFTAVVGAGARIRFTSTLGFKVEAVSYLENGKIGTYNDNFKVTFGGSYYF